MKISLIPPVMPDLAAILKDPVFAALASGSSGASLPRMVVGLAEKGPDLTLLKVRNWILNPILVANIPTSAEVVSAAMLEKLIPLATIPPILKSKK